MKNHLFLTPYPLFTSMLYVTQNNSQIIAFKSHLDNLGKPLNSTLRPLWGSTLKIVTGRGHVLVPFRAEKGTIA